VITLPDTFTDHIQRTFGQAGEAWLEELPALLDELSQRWSLVVDPPFPGISYNFVSPAYMKDNTPAVLKIGVPNPELTSEIAALRHFDGKGAVKLLEADPEVGALLLESIEPGNPLLDLNDDERATSIAAQVMNKLHQSPPTNGAFPTITDWGRGLKRLRSTFNGGSGPFPGQLVDRAERLLEELAASQGEQILLHADLHHWNILASQRSEWLAIDPKGLLGEREYEVGAWLRNPIPSLLDWPQNQHVLRRRIDQFANILGFDRQRMLCWSQYQAVLSAWWSYEEANPNWKQMLAIAELILSVG
jgi:streptomycin 6-kinase